MVFRRSDLDLSFFTHNAEFRSLSVFFFQAEVGIRDATVTGVQTCALPIFPRRLRWEALPSPPDGVESVPPDPGATQSSPPGRAGGGGSPRTAPAMERAARPGGVRAARPATGGGRGDSAGAGASVSRAGGSRRGSSQVPVFARGQPDGGRISPCPRVPVRRGVAPRDDPAGPAP